MADKNFLTDIIDADLAEGKISEIHTRFPPEPNGYLHIGSAKAIYINWSIANQYGGKFNLRLDDTNPAREGEEYVNSIIEDLCVEYQQACGNKFRFPSLELHGINTGSFCSITKLQS